MMIKHVNVSMVGGATVQVYLSFVILVIPGIASSSCYKIGPKLIFPEVYLLLVSSGGRFQILCVTYLSHLCTERAINAILPTDGPTTTEYQVFSSEIIDQ